MQHKLPDHQDVGDSVDTWNTIFYLLLLVTYHTICDVQSLCVIVLQY